MTSLLEIEAGGRHLVMGNEAMARGVLEAGVRVTAGYPGTPSSEIIELLSTVAKKRGMYVEWSVNEKVALEVAAAASFSGLRSLAVMKQVGMNVAADFLLHLAQRGTRGGMVLISCEDPGALSSTNEGESRPYAKMMEFPLVEPGDFQEMKDMIPWAFALSEAIGNVVMVRSVTRLSHASGNVVFGALPEPAGEARFRFSGAIFDPETGPMVNLPGPAVLTLHNRLQEKQQLATEWFNKSPFNTYTGPERPELLVITSSVCGLYTQEAIRRLVVKERVGVLKLGCTWPLPTRLLANHFKRSEKILVIEEVIPFLEDHIEAFAAREAKEIGVKRFFGKHDGSLPRVGELNPDLVMAAIQKILSLSPSTELDGYRQRAAEITALGAPPRELTFCPGCPHRASFWGIHNALQMDDRQGFISGDIGCYSLGALPCGFGGLKTLHSMGSGLGMASGFGKLGEFGFDQPIIAVCGDSTFYHAVMPALVNAIHNAADLTLVVLDNRGTAMTGFQAHPGLEQNAMGESVPPVDIPAVCEAMGTKVRICDPFDLVESQKALLSMLSDPGGVKVLVLRQICGLSPEKKGKKRFDMSVDSERCKGDGCGCNRLCTRIFRCPGLSWDADKRKARIDEVICAGCGVCADICPSGAIQRKEAV
jgi:indolepyruvate ferredoxin oxidoreductase, alpha subunit